MGTVEEGTEEFPSVEIKCLNERKEPEYSAFWTVSEDGKSCFNLTKNSDYGGVIYRGITFSCIEYPEETGIESVNIPSEIEEQFPTEAE